ncbi:MAG: hypothetical protein GY889_09485 [Proteobacteria bacterium]|jgi:hypothetical protein|nr:hypothetical protein [Pseudomonadota bacterium]
MSDLTPEIVQLLAKEQLEAARAGSQSATRAVEQILPLKIEADADTYAQALQLAQNRLQSSLDSLTNLKGCLADWHNSRLGKQQLSKTKQAELYQKLSSTSTALSSPQNKTLQN